MRKSITGLRSNQPVAFRTQKWAKISLPYHMALPLKRVSFVTIRQRLLLLLKSFN